MSPDSDPPSVADVQRIAGIVDSVVRNLAITHCYSRLAAAAAIRTGTGANWCTFATWASRQAGSTIRGEDALAFAGKLRARRAELLHPLQSLWRWLLRRGLLNPASRLGQITAELHTPFDALERAGDAVARGNRKVFAEIGLEFARYLEECPPDAHVSSPEMRAFLDGLRPGDPPDGQRYLRQAFVHYQRQRAEPVPKARAESLLVANLEIGLHEQTRLQPEIREALDAPYVTQHDLGRRVLELLLPSGSRARSAVPDRPAARALGWLAGKVQGAGAEMAREVITGSLMTLSLPGRTLALGAHLPDEFPESLRQLADQDLDELVARFEPVAPAPDDCGARDWAVLEQRMHYIVHLFRATHEDAGLHRAPFTPAQVTNILAGVIPDGELG